MAGGDNVDGSREKRDTATTDDNRIATEADTVIMVTICVMVRLRYA